MDKGIYCYKLSKHLTSFLGVVVTFNEVLDELLLIENGCQPKNEVISKWITSTSTKL